MSLSRIGKYEIQERIGRGAMGEVYKAHDPILSRFVAIKIISSVLGGDEQQRQRFQREAQSGAQINHPNIITIFDFGEEGGVAYIVMELLEGTDLKDIIDSRALTRLEDKLAIMEQIADGLAFAHTKGMVHRDLKPGNIHVLPNGQVKVMDFGLARRSTDHSRTEEIMGTPNYMSPEQVKGERAGPRSDVFSMGGVFYELLTNRKPFGADTLPAVLFNVVHREPEPIKKWVAEPPALLQAVERCLAKDPAQRFADGGELREALRAVRQAMGSALAAGPALAAALDGDTVHTDKRRPIPPALSQTPDLDQTTRDALLELQQYLADSLPPLMVAESVGLLMNCTPQGVAADIYAWAQRKGRGQAAVPLSDILVHSLRKIHRMGEFKLVEKERLSGYLREVGDALVEFCPPQEQEAMRRSLQDLQGAGSMEAAETAAAPAPVAIPEAEAEPRLALLLDRLRQESKAPPASASADDSRSQLIAQALAAVVFSARSGQELDQQLGRMREFGLDSGIGEVFRSLGKALSDWILPAGGGAPTLAAEGREVEAMRRIISLAEEPIEVAKRFRDLVYAAIGQFNQGNLGRAVKMIELAESLVQEKQIQGQYVETVRNKGHESLDQARVKSFAESPDKHPLLRKILNFFFFGLGVPALIDELHVEQRRDRRRLLLTLLQAHGPPARQTARERLEAFVEGRDDPGPYLLRNLVHILRVIPRPPEESPEEEIEIVSRLAEPGQPGILAREAITYLSLTRHPRARQALIKLLHDHEAKLAYPDVSPEKQQEWQAALDKIGAALAHQGGSAAWTSLVDHALSRHPGLGDTMSRLTALASQDLAATPPLAERLLAELQASLPRSVLGFKVSRNDHEMLCAIEALSGTSTAEVRDAFADIVQRFPNDAFARTAARGLEALGAPRSNPDLPVASHNGELEVFGLPTLLHRLAEPPASGGLTLLDREGTVVATLTLRAGRLITCEAGTLKGPDALYQLIERPFGGAFSFEAHAAAEDAPPETAALNVAALTVEGIRRYGELQRASALIPDDASLEATGASPSAVLDEADYDLVVILWEKACAGLTPRQCEAHVPVDAYRIRKALAHWFEEGALRRRSAATPAA